MPSFNIISNLTPCGDQPAAIEKISNNITRNSCQTKSQVLLGVTGSGKTFTMANVIARVKKPTLVIAPNKTLAAQLYSEFKQLFPENAVEYFVSYYDYYQPEAYIPTTGTYIQKDSSINDIIDKMRHSATRAVLARNDVIVVASVSCIFGLGAPEDYLAMRVEIEVNVEISREVLLEKLVNIHYKRSDIDFHRGTFRVRGDRIDIFPAYEEEIAVRIDMFGNLVNNITEFDPLKGSSLKKLDKFTLYPASHYVTKETNLKRAIKAIRQELKNHSEYLTTQNMIIELERIQERTFFDLEMIQEIGYCNGIENYSRHLTGREEGQPPPTLLEYFPEDFLIFIDESHITIPQIRAMYKGDRSRKKTLIQHGFRLPSALDNRPLKFEEWKSRTNYIVYVSATPSDYELRLSKNCIIEQIVRPTGLIDPEITVKGASSQVDDLYTEIKKYRAKQERVLITTLTMKMAENLSEYYSDFGLSVCYLHSKISTMERIEIIRNLRIGRFDAIVGVNLLREGLDIPEVSLVAILDADKEGFLRSTRALIQTFGRAARNENGKVILYADIMTKSMTTAIQETNRRRKIQRQYNRENKITPKTITKEITKIFDLQADVKKKVSVPEVQKIHDKNITESMIPELEQQIKAAVKTLDFELAAKIRDKLKHVQRNLLLIS